MGLPISDSDRARARRMTTNESGRTISDADRRRTIPLSRSFDDPLMQMIWEGRMAIRELVESGKTISDSDRARLMRKYIKRNDGGIAKKTRVF